MKLGPGQFAAGRVKRLMAQPHVQPGLTDSEQALASGHKQRVCLEDRPQKAGPLPLGSVGSSRLCWRINDCCRRHRHQIASVVGCFRQSACVRWLRQSACGDISGDVRHQTTCGMQLPKAASVAAICLDIWRQWTQLAWSLTQCKQAFPNGGRNWLAGRVFNGLPDMQSLRRAFSYGLWLISGFEDEGFRLRVELGFRD